MQILTLIFILPKIICQDTNLGLDSIVDIYKCAEKGLTGNKCLAIVSELTTRGVTKYFNYLQKCKDGQYCQAVSYANEDIGFCTPIIHQGRPGEKCLNDGDCYSYNCTKKKCYGKLDGSLCQSSLECGINSFCVYEDFEHSSKNDPKYCQPLSSKLLPSIFNSFKILINLSFNKCSTPN